jgi:PAS domain S-box-containing protein/putative nucleotidyltransferase with HDIG domain
MKFLSALFKKIQFIQVAPTQFTIFISLYAVFLFLGAYYFSTTITIIIILPFIMISAYRWKVIGGILAGIWSVILIIFSSATHHHTYFQDLIVSLSSYLAIGLLLVILYNYFESQNLKLKESENLYRQLFEQANDAILIVDNEGNIVNCNNVASNLIGYSRNQLLSKNLKEFIIPCPEQINQIENVDPQSGEWSLRDTKGREILFEVTITKLQNGLFLGTGRDITMKKQMEEALQSEWKRAQTYLELVQVIIVALDNQGRVTLINRKGREILGFEAEEIIGKNWFDFFIPKSIRDSLRLYFKNIISGEIKPFNQHENNIINKANEEILISWQNTYLYDNTGNIIGILSAGEDITEQRKSENQIKEQVNTLSVLFDLSQQFTLTLNLKERADEIMQTCVERFGVCLAWLAQAEPGGRIKIIAQYPLEHSYPQQIKIRWDETPEEQGPSGRAIRSGTYQIVEESTTDPSFAPWKEQAKQAGFITSAAFPLISRGRTFGTLNLYSKTPGFFHPERLELFQTIAHYATSSLENARLFEETEQRLKHIQALRTIDMAISGSSEPMLAQKIALEQIVQRLEVDAAALLRFDPQRQTLIYAAGIGFRTPAIEKTSLKLGDTFAGQAALERQIISIPNVSDHNTYYQTQLFRNESFVSYYAVPLLAKGRLFGVLEIFNRSLHIGNEEWYDFLRSLVEQVVIAIDKEELLYNLEKTNALLIETYDATIEGWAYALDLKDRETENHSKRVTELTLKIAREMGIEEKDLVHIRRGALLHDIGKMGIHDSILFKPGKLTNEEWEIMRKHPIYAYEMLSPIQYLHPAIDIPYCHHERWDGSGYPRGLKGEAIPLSARIFAVADNFDALTSNRPYRDAWPVKKALDYIRKQSGKMFDPRVVEIFLHSDTVKILHKEKSST